MGEREGGSELEEQRLWHRAGLWGKVGRPAEVRYGKFWIWGDASRRRDVGRIDVVSSE